MLNPADEIAAWFESAAIAYGYAQDTGRSKVADDILGDLNKMVARAKNLNPSAEARIAALMTGGRTPWVRYCAAKLMMRFDRAQAISSLKQLSGEQGMFVPMCIALVADLESARSA